MARNKRIVQESGWYHVMNRGHSRKYIFLQDNMQHRFLELLDIINEKYGIEIHAYCLMGNHYHLLVHDVTNTLSLAIRYLNSQYAYYFNHVRGRDGCLFRGRFNSILINSERYQANVFRYIHLNPVEAGIVKRPEDYPWSSYASYLNRNTLNPSIDSLKTEDIQNLVSNIPEYISAGIPKKMREIYAKERLPKILK